MEHSRIIEEILKRQKPDRSDLPRKRSAEEALTNTIRRDIGLVFNIIATLTNGHHSYTYIHIYIHTYIQTYTYIHTYIHTYIPRYKRIISFYRNVYLHTYIHTYLHSGRRYDGWGRALRCASCYGKSQFR